MFDKRFQLSSFCLPSEPLIVRKHERLLGRGWLMVWALCVCANISNLLCESKTSNETAFQKWGCSLLFVPNCILESSFCYWLQVSSISPGGLFLCQLKSQIKLNVDFKVSKFMFLLEFHSESLWFDGWSILFAISRLNFVLSCSFFWAIFLRNDN